MTRAGDIETRPETRPARARRSGSSIPFRSRLMLGLIAAAVVPLAAFGLLLIGLQSARSGGPDPILNGLFVFLIAAAAIVGVLFSVYLTNSLTAPLREIAEAVDRVSDGDLSATIDIGTEDELGRLADSHNRLAADLARRNRELGRILVAIGKTSLRDDVDAIAARAGADVRDAFDLIDATVILGDPGAISVQDPVPGEAREVRAMLSLPDERLGVIVGRLPATRSWDPADQDLLELYASELAVSIRNAELFAQVAAQTRRLIELDAAKDDFLRGISHNLQTPLTSIRAYADQLAGERPDQRLEIITEQSERLSRMVRQLLTVSRLESGALRPKAEVLALGPRVRRTWEALAADGVELALDDRAQGWLAVGDPDQLDQVLWALLDNAVKYGRRGPVRAEVAVDPDPGVLRLTISDAGPGVTEADRTRLFGRFERSALDGHPEGTGLGLYVSRALCRAMGGDLELAPPGARPGAAFVVTLPGEPPEDG